MTNLSPEIPRWFCVRTQTKREHIAAKHLRNLDGVEVFCPRIKYRKATRRGKIWWMEPLFPGYILAKFKREEMERTVTYCQGVRGLIRFGTEIPDIPEDSVRGLIRQVTEQAAEDEEEIITLTNPLQTGDEVEIATGPFQGMKGIISNLAPATERVKVLIEFLGEERPIDLDLFTILNPSKPIPIFY